MFLDERGRRAALRADIRADISRERGDEASGGDFYGPFWSDAKEHVFRRLDLVSATAARIDANPRRRNLYPQLRDGFLLWWNDRRRWTNEPFNPGQTIKSVHRFGSLDAVVKLNNLLVVRDGMRNEFAVYHYCFPEPALNENSARLGLWLLTRAFPHIAPSEFRILDVIRGQTFSIDRVTLTGEEEIEFEARYARLIRERDELRREYD